ncbi:ABC transporter [Gracilaria domingensis]|nr:ABC transporter [Gracilaria domingensis]
MTDRNTGILGELSLEPFIFPGALPGNAFHESQTSYDGVFLHSYFDGNSLHPVYQRFVSVERNGQIDENYEMETIPVASKEELSNTLFNSWLKGNFFPPFTNAISFENAQRSEDNGISLSATLFYNESESSNCTESCPLVSSVISLENAIFKTVSPGNSALAFLRRMPVIPVQNDLGFIKLIISVIIGLISHFLLPNYLQIIVQERVARLRAMMETMGLRKRNYWLGTYVGLFIEYILSQALIMIMGAVIGISFYTDNAPLSYIILFFLWGNVLIAHAVLFAPFFGSPETAQTFGWFYVLIVNLVGGPYLGRRLSDDTATEGTWASIMLLPSFAFLRSVYFAGAVNSGGRGITIGPETYRDVALGICQGRGIFCRSYLFLAIQFFVLFTLGLYFDLVIPTGHGTRLHPLFFIGFKRKVKTDDMEENVAQKGLESDILSEEARAHAIVQNIENEPFEGVVLDRLSKTYPGNPPVKAVQGLSFVVKQNEVLSIMAPNGAGKTSAFRTLIGELEPTSGNALIFGHSIINDLQQIHKSMGVAPQQDILWDILTIQEHLFFYGRLRNLYGNRLKEEVEKTLESVQLTFARNRKVQIISGGMKRRLSVSIAMIGNPRFIILDEPSTGLDIVAREKLWNSIQRIKEDKAVILTTHSLEEAEALSTRVAIMSRGRLMCIGTPEDLKLRLGKGHRLSVSLPESEVGALHDAILSLASGAVVETSLGGNVEYALPRSFAVAKMFSMMVARKEELRIRDWSINQSTLEDVFLQVTERTRRTEMVDGQV